MSDWEKILNFAEWLAAYGKKFSTNENFEEQRMAIVLLDQSMELMMKAFLIKKGYKIDYFSREDISRGLKEKDSLSEEMMIEFFPALALVKKELHDIDDNEIKHFHKIRNKIYHGAIINLKEDKVSEIEKFLPELWKFYEVAFEGKSFDTDILDKVPDTRNR